MRKVSRITTFIVLTLLVPSAALSQECSVTFEIATVKPSILESLIIVVRSLNPKGEAQRLSSLRQDVQELKKDKRQLSETLQTVLQQSSVQNWWVARVEEIPRVQKEVLRLLQSIRSEADTGGLFAGDKSFASLRDLVDQKKRDLGRLCLLSAQPLPLRPELRQQMQTLITDLDKEVNALGSIDDALAALISRARDETLVGKEKQKKI
jgi:hypothetical protein